MQLSENLQGSTQRCTHNSHPHPNEQIVQPEADRYIALRSVIARRTDKLLN